ncbi:decarboxylase [Pochonia chlamydosporia 170]|uniref:Decarboxylase n=1 Tax=Pochonia chlamydosporia 170 TaxID=1380566 RepID=A0A179F4Z2_METCM|nr:decarboxylase [Pochonia chlamydosporia 170]OAQ60485.1 decarboxylase [Pochonia chlamydosporia 170]
MEFTTSLLIESWILYALGVAIVICRMVSRRIKLGKWRNLMIDDYLMVFALVNFTGVVVSINEVAKNGSNYMSAEAAAALTPEGVDRAVYGSIMTFVLEIFTITGTWTIKACLLILYARLTRHTLTKQHLLVKIAAAYCVVTYLVVTFMFVFYWCSPTPEYWAVPVRIDQCATYYHHMIFATACNISSDILLLLIPIPIIVKTRLPAKRKIILVCILGLGVFNILAAILNRYYNFSNPNSYVFLYWYVAEVGIAMLVGNMPLCWPVLRALFGVNDKTDTPSYHGYTFSGGGRKNKKPKNILSTTMLGSTMWDKLDEQEETAGTKTDSHEQTVSDQGSQIELVFQGHAHSHHHHAAVSANPEQTDVSQSSAVLSSGSSGQSQTRQTGDKIMVVTTVDVSSTESRK